LAAGVVAAVAACASMILLPGVGAAAGSNLATNSGFETGSTSGWSCDATASVVTSPVHSGSYALSDTPTGQNDGQCTQTVSVQPNSAYTLSAWVQGSYVYLGVTGTGTTDVSTWTPGASTYSQLSTSFTTGASTSTVSIYLHGWYGQPTYYADDVSLTGPGGSAQAPSAPSGLAVTATTSSSASLSWTGADGTVSGYNVYRNGSKVGTTTSSSYTDSGLSAATSYTYTVTAYNSIGESAPSASVKATTASSGGGGTSPGGGSLPAHVLTGYWQDFTNAAEPLKLSSVPTGYGLVAVAFANADSANDGGVTFSIDPDLSTALGGYSISDFTSDVATLHSRGQKVIISVGGQNGTISVASSSAATNFASSIDSLMSTYGFDGVDIDLENGVNPTYMAQRCTRSPRRIPARSSPWPRRPSTCSRPGRTTSSWPWTSRMS
jgi:hypothetical protein